MNKQILLVLIAILMAGTAYGQQAGRPRKVATKPATPCNARDFIAADDTGVSSNCNPLTLLWEDVAHISGGVPADRALDNLTSPTAINQSLLPGTDNSINLGSVSKRWADTQVMTVVASTSIGAPFFKSAAADPADAGAFRVGNGELIEWESNPTGTDLTLGVDTNNVLTSSVPINATTGFRIGNAAASGHYLRGNATNYVDSAIQAGDVPTLNQNTTGTAANLSGTPALPNGTTATTQSQSDNSTKVATTAYVDTMGATKAPLTSPAFIGAPTISVGQTTSAATDLLINPTTKASGKFIDAQVNNAGKFNVDFAGNTGVGATAPASLAGVAHFLDIGGGSAGLDLHGQTNNWELWTGGTGDFNIYSNSIPGGYAVVIAPTTGATNIIGTLAVGSGTPILKHLSATATLDFANLAAIGCEDLTITVTGAALGDTVAIGVPNASVVANGTFTGWVSSSGVVTVRFCTVVSGNPASGTFRADVWQH